MTTKTALRIIIQGEDLETEGSATFINDLTSLLTDNNHEWDDLGFETLSDGREELIIDIETLSGSGLYPSSKDKELLKFSVKLDEVRQEAADSLRGAFEAGCAHSGQLEPGRIQVDDKIKDECIRQLDFQVRDLLLDKSFADHKISELEYRLALGALDRYGAPSIFGEPKAPDVIKEDTNEPLAAFNDSRPRDSRFGIGDMVVVDNVIEEYCSPGLIGKQGRISEIIPIPNNSNSLYAYTVKIDEIRYVFDESSLRARKMGDVDLGVMRDFIWPDEEAQESGAPIQFKIGDEVQISESRSVGLVVNIAKEDVLVAYIDENNPFNLFSYSWWHASKLTLKIRNAE